MVDEGVIKNYAVFGAVAQMRYTEAVVTIDADILVVVPDAKRMDVLSPIYEFCLKRGYQPEGESIRVGAWPVQFIPTFDPLTESAVADAEVGDMDGEPFRVVKADYLAVIALGVGRPKDFTRILSLIEAGATTVDAICRLAGKHGLAPAWQTFQERFYGR